MPNEINMDVRANGLDDLLNKTSEVRDNLDGIDQARENLTENQIKLIDDDQLQKIRDLKSELEHIQRLRQNMARDYGISEADLMPANRAKIAREYAEILQDEEAGVPSGLHQQRIEQKYHYMHQYEDLGVDRDYTVAEIARLEGNLSKKEVNELKIDALANERKVEKAQEKDRKEQEKTRSDVIIPDIDELALIKKEKKEAAMAEREEERKQKKVEAEADKLERERASGIQQMSRAGMQQLAHLTGIPVNAMGIGGITGIMAGGAALGVGAIAGMGMFANMIADYTDRAREPGAQYFGIVQQIAAATGKSSALVSAELLSGQGGNLDRYGIGIDQRAQYARQMSQVFGSYGTQEAWLGTANFALRAGIDPSIAMGQISTMKRSVDFTGGDMIGFLQQMDSLRGMGYVGGRAGIAIENVAGMAQAQVGISGVMPDVTGVNAMTEAYAGLAGTGESGANLGGRFEAKFAGAVSGASGPNNAFLLRAFMADSSVKSHTLEEFEYWKEQVLTNKKVHYIMDYAKKEFGSLAPIALKRMGLATISESREYAEGRPVGVGKGGISPDAALPGPVERTNLYKTAEERFSRFEAYDPTWEAKQTSREVGQALRQAVYRNANTMGNLLDQIDPMEQVMVDPDKGYQNIRQALGPSATEKEVADAAFNAGLATYREANTGVLKVEFSEEAKRVFVGKMEKQAVGFTGFCNIPEAN
jgi:hypothetical protein